jgi:hypothetical protein
LNKILGISLVVLGLAIAIVPQFTDCASQGHFMTVMGNQVPMTCHWAARGEIAVGAPLMVMGGVMSFSRRRSGFFALGILGVVAGGFTMFLPHYIIDTCPGPTMACNTLMRPSLTALGSLTVIGSVVGMVLGKKAST